MRERLVKLLQNQAGEGKRFPALTNAFELTGDTAQLALDLARVGRRVDARNEVVIAILLEKPALKLLVVDKRTLRIQEAGEYSSLDDPPEARDGTDFSDVDPRHIYWLLLKDAAQLPVNDCAFNIADYRDAHGPKRLPALRIEPPREPAQELWLDDTARAFLAARLNEPSFEVTGADARRFNDVVGGYYVAKDDVLVVTRDDTRANPKLTILSLDRRDLDVHWQTTVTVTREFANELLANARPLQRAARKPAMHTVDLRLVQARAAKPLTVGSGNRVRLAGLDAHELKLHPDVIALEEEIEEQPAGVVAFWLPPAMLRRALADERALRTLLFDVVRGGDIRECPRLQFDDVGRDGALAAMKAMIDDDALEPTLLALLDRMGGKQVFDVDTGDGGTRALVVLDEETGTICALVAL